MRGAARGYADGGCCAHGEGLGAEVAVGGGEEAAYEEGEGGEGGEVVVLLAGGEGEEAEDDAGPEEAGESRLLRVVRGR